MLCFAAIIFILLACNYLMYQLIEKALKIQFQQLIDEPRRIFHGRGYLYVGLEHINLDWFPPVLLITGYKTIEDADSLISLVKQQDELDQIKSIVLQRRSGKGAPSDCVWGENIPKFIVVENGLRFEVQPGVHQNAGLFLDMRLLRTWLKQYSKGKNVLNLFAYTCSLSVAAMAGCATQVVNVDMNRSSINWGNRNHELNDQDLRSVRTIPHNIFRSWGKIQKMGPFDLVIIDPPSRQRGSFDAGKDYVTILKRLTRLCKPGSDIIATLNSPYLGSDYLPNLMQRYQPKYQLLRQFPASTGFEDKFPEKGLKVYHFRG